MSIESLIEPHIYSYNKFIENLPNLFNSAKYERYFGKYKFIFKFSNIEITQPIYRNKKLSANLAKHFLKTYDGNVFAQIDVQIEDTELKKIIRFSERRTLGPFPILLNSNLCYNKNIRKEDHSNYLNYGGFFIVSGVDRFIRFLNVQRRNIPFYFISENNIKINNTFTKYYITVRSVNPMNECGYTFNIFLLKNGSLTLKFYVGKNDFYIPLILILRALKKTTDKEIFNLLDIEDEDTKKRVENLFMNNMVDHGSCKNYLISLFSSYTHDIFEIILPHLQRKEEKYYFLINIVKQLYRKVYLTENHIGEGDINTNEYTNKMNKNLFDDIDNPAYSELLGINQIFSPILLSHLIRTIKYGKSVQNIENILDIHFNSVEKEATIKSSISTFIHISLHSCGSLLRAFLRSGNLPQNIMTSDILHKMGLSLILENINIYRYLGNMISINRGSFFQKIKVTSVRKLRGESFGFICPVHTPDGTPCGLLTHRSLNSFIAHREYINMFELYRYGLLLYNKREMPVFLNGKIVGSIKNIKLFLHNLQHYKIEKNSHMEFFIKDSSFYIQSTESRLMRTIKFKNKHLMNIGMCEQLNGGEFTELEKHNFLSLHAALTPFSDYNQSPRNMYQCQMLKQSIGYSLPIVQPNSFLLDDIRSDSKYFSLIYPSRPIVKTHIYDKFNLQQYLVGMNAVVAILSYSSYDMEDALLLNKASIERGFGDAFLFRNHLFECTKIISTPEIGQIIKRGDVLAVLNDRDNIITHRYKNNESAIVHAVKIFNSNESENVHIILKERRMPIVGDKFSSRHGQKGILSIKYDSRDMPFLESGIQPDIIINPHAFPSRMTIGMMLESICSYIPSCAYDSTPFNFISKDKRAYDYFQEKLREYNISERGTETAYSGFSGKPLRTTVFCGVVYYQRLRHMVMDKYQVRNIGPVAVETKQPIKGRKRGGGIKVGEMERDCLISHGTAFILKERLLSSSDGTVGEVCQICKSLLFLNNERVCHCGSRNIKKIEMPFVLRYLYSELLAMGIKMNIEF